MDEAGSTAISLAHAAHTVSVWDLPSHTCATLYHHPDIDTSPDYIDMGMCASPDLASVAVLYRGQVSQRDTIEMWV
jgi:hypothetical protein